MAPKVFRLIVHLKAWSLRYAVQIFNFKSQVIFTVLDETMVGKLAMNGKSNFNESKLSLNISVFWGLE